TGSLHPARLDGDRPRLAVTPDTARHDLCPPLVGLPHDRDELLEASERPSFGLVHDVTHLDGCAERARIRDEHAGWPIARAVRPNGRGTARCGQRASDRVGADG